MTNVQVQPEAGERSGWEGVPLERLEGEICSLGSPIPGATCRWVLAVAEFDRRGVGGGAVPGRTPRAAMGLPGPPGDVLRVGRPQAPVTDPGRPGYPGAGRVAPDACRTSWDGSGRDLAVHCLARMDGLMDAPRSRCGSPSARGPATGSRP